ncbi:MAG: TIGR01459 family HAD-type hydrolase [Alphaproteobacteria bacterium]|nr:TIGR01459 family HAD-type hydrolase [Alphaproteobacteria bacterium]
MTDPQPMRFLDGIQPIVDAYDGFILDLWGCLHDGIRAYPGVRDCLLALRRRGKRICLLSNAPRRIASVIRRIEPMGLTADLYDEILSSGEATWRALADRADPWHAALGRRCWHMGPAKDNDVHEGTGLTMVAGPDGADFVLATGIHHAHETVAEHEGELAAARRRNLPMICANPDLVVMVGEDMQVCAGSFARRYQELGGEVFYHGKPHAPVYQVCFELIGIPDRRRILAVGDSLRTDVAGANAAGIDCLLITSGIHGEEFGLDSAGKPDRDRIRAAIARERHRPNGIIPAFTW